MKRVPPDRRPTHRMMRAVTTEASGPPDPIKLEAPTLDACPCCLGRGMVTPIRAAQLRVPHGGPTARPDPRVEPCDPPSE